MKKIIELILIWLVIFGAGVMITVAFCFFFFSGDEDIVILASLYQSIFIPFVILIGGIYAFVNIQKRQK